ncbi:hypothetical protein GJA_1746 [Janthinobacterium agaricidamnosum NBRC 102515 = DSM 9628]|uniref:Uncharacterized protein n=1 Tax=Janthinobacterium agaricidamnosum NBRC 102515 = DSM 9628 TaxID=1349767 RepID=W0V525_9BURK|nr:hypothetical protein GJA_1746 [Janthinobacterium agaricidamnosum NBRC 102515 = DSM 9628]
MITTLRLTRRTDAAFQQRIINMATATFINSRPQAATTTINEVTA